MFHRSIFKKMFGANNRYISNLVDISPEVQAALHEKKAVVALESTIITHGMPHPKNYETAIAVESIIRNQGCVPAHVAICDGRIKVGLDNTLLQKISNPVSKPIKTSRRDFPYVISNGLCGGTTVCGTLLVARNVGINVFVTGGIGGVHRHGEDTMDISADLKELGRHPIMVVSSGVKSILDIELTLEYLETEGVCVVSYGPSKQFPAFYSAKSGFFAPYHVETPKEAASLLYSNLQLNMKSGLLLAVPVPLEFSFDYDAMNATIDVALKEAEQAGVTGKNITPFILDKISHITSGKTLETNIALIKNNAHIGALVAKEFEQLHRVNQHRKPSVSYGTNHRNPVVIGASIVDCLISVDTDLEMDGRTHPGKIEQSPGGVGRNLADAIGKLYNKAPPLFLSAVGSDQYGLFLLDSLKHIDSSGVITNEKTRTACYSTLVDKFGEAKFGVCDMYNLLNIITPEQVAVHKNTILNSPMLIIDGNISQNTINHVLELAKNYNIPTWYEPTDLIKAVKPFTTDLWKSIKFASPNVNELISMAKAIGVTANVAFDDSDLNTFLRQLAQLSVALVEYIPVLMITLGKKGLLMASRMKHDEPLNNVTTENTNIYFRYYPVQTLPTIVNAVGAGDSTAAGFISGTLQGFTEPECINLGMRAAHQSLTSTMAIPKKFELDTSIQLKTEFITITI